MSDIITIAQSTFGRFARLKSMYIVMALCVTEVWVASLYNELTMGLHKELMIDCTLALLTLISLFTAMAVTFEKSRELREKTAQFILTKPGGRSSFIWGKFLGISAVAVFNIAIVTIGALWVYNSQAGEIHKGLSDAAILIAGQAIILTGVGLVLSMFLSDVLATIGLVLVAFAGHAAIMLPRMSGGDAGIAGATFASKAAYYIAPGLFNLNIGNEISASSVPSSYIAWGLAYAVLYGFALTGLATLIFSRKDISE